MVVFKFVILGLGMELFPVPPEVFLFPHHAWMVGAGLRRLLIAGGYVSEIPVIAFKMVQSLVYGLFGLEDPNVVEELD